MNNRLSLVVLRFGVTKIYAIDFFNNLQEPVIAGSSNNILYIWDVHHAQITNPEYQMAVKAMVTVEQVVAIK